MKKAVDALYSQEHNGNWEATPAGSSEFGINGLQWSGTTAITTYALLCTGEHRRTRVSRRPSAFWLRTSKGVYASAARCLVWSRSLAVIFSREDLSAGLVGEPVDGITGYSPASATELMTNILLSEGR